MTSDIDLILEDLPLAAARIGAGERLEQMNDPARRLFGAAGEGRHFGMTFRQPELLAAITEARREGQGKGARIVLAGERETLLEARVTPLADGFFLTFRDLSDLAQTDQMRRDFVANVSHELRTPLTSLLGFIETLRGPAREDAAARARFLAIMSGEAERMARLVHDLLQLSRVESEERQRPETVQDLSALVREAVSNLSPLAAAGQVTIRLEGLEQPHRLRADRDQMLQVLSNLVENAIKYGSKPGSGVHVALKDGEGPKGAHLILSVADEGEGIEAHHLPRLTERFYRVDSHRSREMGGTGLGLAIVKHIVNRHRGRLLVQSEPGKGSTFSVLLPLDP